MLVSWVCRSTRRELLGGELNGGQKVGRNGVAAGLGKDGADDLDELELQEVEVEEVVVVKDLNAWYAVSVQPTSELVLIRSVHCSSGSY